MRRSAVMLCMAVGCGVPAFAAEKTYDADLGEVTVTTPYRTAMALSDLSSDVDVITAEDAEKSGASNVVDLLAKSGDVAIPQSGFGQATPYSIDGSEAYQTRVMLDGIDMRTQATEYVRLGAIPSYALSQVEVLRGASSSVWGSGMGGAINMITKAPSEKPVSVKTQAFVSGYRGRRESTEVSGTQDKLGYYVSEEYRRSGTECVHDETEQTGQLHKATYDFGAYGKLNGLYGANIGMLGSGFFPSDFYPEGSYYQTAYRQRFGKMGWSKDWDDVRLSADWKSSGDVNSMVVRNDDGTEYAAGSSKGRHDQGSLFSSWDVTEQDVVNAGYDADHEYLKSLNETFPKAKTVTAHAPYASWIAKRDAWTYESALRYDHSSQYSGAWSPSAGVSRSFDMTLLERVKLNVGRSFTMPRLLWKYYGDTGSADPSFVPLNNPSLKPEKAWTTNLSAEGKLAAPLAYQTSLFYSDIVDMLTTETTVDDMGTPGDDTDDVWHDQFVNKQRFRKTGGSGELTYTFLRDWKAGSGAHVYRYYDRKAHAWAEPSGLPSHSVDFSLGYDNPRIVQATIMARYTRFHMPYDAYQPNDRKLMFDFTSKKTMGMWSVFFNVYNLADSKYWTDYYKPYPGRYFETGVGFEW